MIITQNIPNDESTARFLDDLVVETADIIFIHKSRPENRAEAFLQLSASQQDEYILQALSSRV